MRTFRRAAASVVLALASAGAAADGSLSTWELETLIEQKTDYFHRAPCNVSIGFLVHLDTRCRVAAPLTPEDRERGVLRKVIVNMALVCRKPVGDIAVDYAHVYEERPEKVWHSVAVSPDDRELIATACEAS